MNALAYMGTVLLAAFIFSTPFDGFAGEGPGLSLVDAVEMALKNNRVLRATRRERDAETRRVGQARAAFFPRVDIIEDFSYSDSPDQVFSGLLGQASLKQRHLAVGFLNNPTPLTNLGSQVRLEQPLYRGGKLTANLELAKASEDASEGVTRRQEQEVLTGVTEAYYQVLLAEENLGVVDKAMRSAQAHLRRASDLHDQGVVVRSDVLRTEVLVGSLERERIEAENAITIARSRLGHIIGLERKGFRLTERIKEDALPVDELNIYFSRALSSRPDLRAADKRVEAAAHSVEVAEADYYPSLGFVTQFEGNTRKFSSSGESFAVFVTARWNLFNGFATQEKAGEARVRLERAKILREDLAQRVALEVEEAYLGLLTARKQVAVARENVRQGEESLRIIGARYGGGLAGNVDVLDAEATLKKAEQDLLQAQVNSQVFRSRLDLATGRLR